jgi:large subunit ribosomal protein L29
MKASTIREQTSEELGQLLEDTQRELVDLNVKRGVQDSSEQPLRIRSLRRDVARIKTVLGEKAHAAARKQQQKALDESEKALEEGEAESDG